MKADEYYERELRDIDRQLDELRPLLKTKENEREYVRLMQLQRIYARSLRQMREWEASKQADQVAAAHGYRAEYV